MRQIEIYTDGSCKGNPGPGGWGAILRYNNHEKELSGGEPNTTNNRMELTALIRAVEQLKEPCHIILTSDSQYVINALQKGWASGWKNKGWKKKDGKPALNSDLWEQMLELAEKHSFTYEWIRGHSGHAENERCDTLAVLAAETYL